MDKLTCECYLRDLWGLLKEKALRAKTDAETARGSSTFDFELGRLMGFHEAISLMQQQAVAFGISVEQIGLADIMPERDLLIEE